MTTVQEYLNAVPEDRKKEMQQVRNVILQHLPEGYEEGIEYGMIGYFIPLADYPKTYNGHPLCYVALASQKNYMSLYLMGVYGSADEEKEFRDAYAASGKKLSMGKSCIRFKKANDLALDVIGETIAAKTPTQFIATYEHTRPKTSK